MKEITKARLETAIALLIIFYVILTAYLMIKIHPAELLEWKDLYQVEKQRAEQCVRNFEAITPQLDQKIIHLYPYNVEDHDEMKLEDGVVK